MVKKRIWALPLAIALVGLASGCGSSDEATTISKAQFLAGGNRICAQTVERQTAAYQRIGEEVEGKQLTRSEGHDLEGRFVGEVVATVETMIEEFEELGVPAGKEEAVSEMLDEYREGAEATDGKPQVFLSGTAFRQADQRAGKIGLNKCEGM